MKELLEDALSAAVSKRTHKRGVHEGAAGVPQGYRRAAAGLPQGCRSPSPQG